MSFVINIYSDNHQSALKYLKNIKVNLNNVLIITEDFNIRDNNWDSLYPHHLIHADTLRDITDSFNLELSISIIQVSTRYANNSQESNSGIDLIFLCANGEEFNKHMISPNLHGPSNHTLLFVNIIIEDKFIEDKKQTTIKNSIDEENFVNELKNRVEYINLVNIPDCKMLEKITQEFMSIIEEL